MDTYCKWMRFWSVVLCTYVQLVLITMILVGLIACDRGSDSSEFTDTNLIGHTAVDDVEEMDPEANGDRWNDETESDAVTDGNESSSDDATMDAARQMILPLGDSITEGDPATYRYELFRLLSERGVSFDFVGSWQHNPLPETYTGDWSLAHEGHAGWTTEDIRDTLNAPTWLGSYTPNIALIHLGTNDIFGFEVAEDLHYSVSNMRRIVETLRADNPRIEVYIAQILPITSNYNHDEEEGPTRPWNSWVTQYNQALGALVLELNTTQSPLRLVDMNTAFGNAELPDGIHPNTAGAKKMAERWEAALMESFTP